MLYGEGVGRLGKRAPLRISCLHQLLAARSRPYDKIRPNIILTPLIIGTPA